MAKIYCLMLVFFIGCSSVPDSSPDNDPVNVEAFISNVDVQARQLATTLAAQKLTGEMTLENTQRIMDKLNTLEASIINSETSDGKGGDVPASMEAVVVEASEPVSGKEVIQQSTSTSSLDTVADDGVHFEAWTADWCGVCRIQKPILAAVAKELGIPEPRELQWEKHKKYAYLYDIDGLPVVSVLRRGKTQKVLHGLQSREQLMAAVSNVRALQLTPDGNVITMASSDDLTIRNKLPVVNTRWGLQDLEEVNTDGTCQCEKCVELRALKSAYLAKPEYQNIGRKVEPETF